MSRALLVVDVQRAFGWEENKKTFDPQQSEVKTALVERLRQAREADDVVAFVLLDGNKWKLHEVQINMAEYCIGCDSGELPRFFSHRHEPSFEPIFVKRGDDAFFNPQLSKYLHAHGVGEIALAGCWTFDCVQQTALGALMNNFRVILFEDAVYPSFGGEEERNRWRDLLVNAMGKIDKNSNFSLKIE